MAYKEIKEVIETLEAELAALSPGQKGARKALEKKLAKLQEKKKEAFKEFMGVGQPQTKGFTMTGGTR